MKNAMATGIYHSGRYRILEIDSKYYLIDMYRSWVGFILPFLSWFFPHNVIKLSEEEALKVLAVTHRKKGPVKKVSILKTGGIAVSLNRLIASLNLDFAVPINGILLLILAVGVAIFIRFIHLEKKGKWILDEINLEGKVTRKLLIFPASLRGLLIPLFTPLVCVAFAFAAAWVTFITGSLLSWVGMVVFLLLILLMSSLAVVDGKYKIIFLNAKKQKQNSDVA